MKINIKNKKIGLLAVAALVVIGIVYACGKGNNVDVPPPTDTTNVATSNLPLNISVYLDLSDRLTRDLTPSQVERDTAIINHLVDIFIDDAVTRGKIANSKNRFQVLFYPAPNNKQIAMLAKSLNVDLDKTAVNQKKVVLSSMKEQIQKSLSVIYSDVLNNSVWTGCDIWGFFSNKKVDDLCIKPGYRNILVILTDGYLYHQDNKIQKGNEFSYILPQTLSVPESSLLVNRKGLDDLEVLMLEINPYDPKQQALLTEKLQDWFNGMEVKNFVVSDTDLPVNTEHVIDSFLDM